MWSNLKRFPIIPALLIVVLLVRLLAIDKALGLLGIIALVISVIWFAISLIRWLSSCRDAKLQSTESSSPFDREAEADEEDDDPIISLVYFLSEARDANEKTIRECFNTALNSSFDPNDDNASEFVLEITPQPSRPVEADGTIRHFMVRLREGMFSVLVSPVPYIDDPIKFARDSIRDKRLRTAVETHQAWLSVDLMGEQPSEEQKNDAYSVIGKAMASMAGPDCLALYCPELQRCNEFDLNLMEVLTGGKPLDLFEEPTFEPVIEVSEDDPKMAAAVNEAIERWPEFVKAFEKDAEPGDDRFIIKAEFTENSRSEFMWVAVNRIESSLIHGTLMNDPHELLDVHRGAEVHIEIDRLNDWLYPGGEEDDPIGGFTLRVLADNDEGDE